MARQLAAAPVATSPALPVVVQDELLDLDGSVTGPDGPIEDATVTLIFKSWPNGQFRPSASPMADPLQSTSPEMKNRPLR